MRKIVKIIKSILNTLLNTLLNIVLCATVTLLAITIIGRLTGIFMVNQVSGSSMLPNFIENEFVISTNQYDELDYGDVVIARSEDKNVIKRIIGKPGDVIEITKTEIYVNNEKIDEEYISSKDNTNKEKIYILNGEEYFIAGDNRPASYDSRSYGPIHKDQIKGIVIYKIGFNNSEMQIETIN